MNNTNIDLLDYDRVKGDVHSISYTDIELSLSSIYPPRIREIRQIVNNSYNIIN